MGQRPVVNQDECIGCGTCAEIASKSFRLNDDEKAEVIHPPGDSDDVIQEAMDSCPTEAISWEDD